MQKVCNGVDGHTGYTAKDGAAIDANTLGLSKIILNVQY
jgi:hypothetical protein